ncbi:hypothetical protein GJ496_003577 [Pomphorhynchus laevis]|nr:hypothetical protein GJ496_003577 [Pomphorhynchus laevis]
MYANDKTKSVKDSEDEGNANVRNGKNDSVNSDNINNDSTDSRLHVVLRRSKRVNKRLTKYDDFVLDDPDHTIKEGKCDKIIL